MPQVSIAWRGAVVARAAFFVAAEHSAGHLAVEIADFCPVALVAAKSSASWETCPNVAGSRNAWAMLTLCQLITSLSHRAVRRCVFFASSNSHASPVRL